MAYYSVDGEAHRALRRLAEGPARTLELKVAMRPEGTARQRNKGWYVVDQLRRDDCLHPHLGLWAITHLGRDALACLDAGTPFVSGHPSVRIFRSAA